MKYFYYLLLYSIYISTSAQVSYDTTSTALQMAQLLAGKNVSVSNASIICKSNQYATFQAHSSWNLGIDTGVVLSTGIIRSYSPFPTPCNGVWTPNPISGWSCFYGLDKPSQHRFHTGSSIHQWNHKVTVQDADLLSIVNPNTITDWWPTVLLDRCFLQFNAIPKGDSITFDYLMASGEYNAYHLGDTSNCSSPDAFGLFISGAGIVGKKNLALIPGTNTPVNTNTIGPNKVSCLFLNTCDPLNGYPSDTAYFLGECNGIPNHNLYVFDTSNDYFPLHGRTKPLRASQKVIPDSTYTLKFAIADVGQPGFDAFVFIRAGSLESPGLYQPRVYSSGDTLPSLSPYAIEGCGAVQVKLRSSRIYTTAQSLSLSYGGTAIPGQLSTLPTTLTLPAGDSLLSFSFSALANTLSQPNRTLTIYLTNNSNYYDTLQIQILDHAKDWTLLPDTFVCRNQSVTLQSNIPIFPEYNILWSGAPLSDPTSNTPIYTANTVLDSIQFLAQLLHPTCPSISQNVNLKIKPIPTIQLFSDTFVCRGDSITIVPSILPVGNYQYFYAPHLELSQNDSPTTKAFPSQNRFYSLRVTSEYGCGSLKSFNIQSIAPKSLLDSFKITPDTCFKNKGAVTLFPNTNFTSFLDYRQASNPWQSNTTLTSILSGMQSIQVRYRNQCILDTILQIPNQAPQVTFTPIIQRCGLQNGSISVSISNFKAPITYLWNTQSNSQSITQLDSGKYLLLATDVNGCVVRDSFQMPFDPPAKIGFRSIEPLCGRNDAYLVAVPQSLDTPYTYIWNTGSVSDSLFGISAGLYWVVAHDRRGCEVTDSIQIQSSNAPILRFVASPSRCNLTNGTISVSIQGGTPPFTYLWSDGNTASNRTAFISNKTYGLKIMDALGCSDSGSVFLDSIPKFTTFATIDTPFCSLSNGQMSVQVFGALGQVKYRWNGQAGNAIRSNLDSGKMTLIVSDSFCADTSFYHLPYKNKAIRLLSEAVVNKTCFPIHSGKITTTLEGGWPPYTYQWSHGDTTANIANLMEGSYGLVARDQQGCVYAKNYVITTPRKIETIDTLYHLRCFGSEDGSIRLGVIGGIPPYKYLWNNGKTTPQITNLSASTYTVKVQDSMVCIDSFSFMIREPEKLRITKLAILSPRCVDSYDGQIEVIAEGGVGGIDYKLEPIQKVFSKQNRYFQMAPDHYTLMVRDSAGCMLDTMIILENAQPKSIEIAPEVIDLNLGSKEMVQILSTPRATTWKTIAWHPESWFSCSYCPSSYLQTYMSGEIKVKAMDSLGCVYESKATVYVKDTHEIYIPNAINLNNRSASNIWKIYGNHIRKSEVKLFNRWGEQVYESQNAHLEGWDGRFKGEHVASGIYIYTCRIILLNGMIKVFKGDLVVID